MSKYEQWLKSEGDTFQTTLYEKIVRELMTLGEPINPTLRLKVVICFVLVEGFLKGLLGQNDRLTWNVRRREARYPKERDIMLGRTLRDIAWGR